MVIGEPKNAINVYACTNVGCGTETVTRNAAEGTTPMTIRCPQCGCTSMSRWYRVDQTLIPSHEWYRPASTKGLSREVRAHVGNGGLLLRRVGDPEPDPERAPSLPRRARRLLQRRQVRT